MPKAFAAYTRGYSHYVQHKLPTLQVGTLALNRPSESRPKDRDGAGETRFGFRRGLVVLATLVSFITWGNL